MNCRAFPRAVAVVGLVASVLLSGRPLAAAAEPLYLRIVVSPTCTVYVDFTQPEMRVAAAPGQFDAAAPENAASGWT
jgi:hypothetical protein